MLLMMAGIGFISVLTATIASSPLSFPELGIVARFSYGARAV
jgi:hypothetical protein